MQYEIRTDLALENREIYRSAQKIEDEIPGIETEIDDSDSDILITKVKILSDEGANALGKPIGNYITIESQMMNDEVENIDNKIIQKVSEIIKDISHLVKSDTVLVVGLGNGDVTPDALGPKVIENLQITRHLIEYAPEYVKEGTRATLLVILELFSFSISLIALLQVEMYCAFQPSKILHIVAFFFESASLIE